jgi:hypothetical protein
LRVLLFVFNPHLRRALGYLPPHKLCNLVPKFTSVSHVLIVLWKLVSLVPLPIP